MVVAIIRSTSFIIFRGNLQNAKSVVDISQIEKPYWCLEIYYNKGDTVNVVKDTRREMEIIKLKQPWYRTDPNRYKKSKKLRDNIAKCKRKLQEGTYYSFNLEEALSDAGTVATRNSKAHLNDLDHINQCTSQIMKTRASLSPSLNKLYSLRSILKSTSELSKISKQSVTIALQADHGSTDSFLHLFLEQTNENIPSLYNPESPATYLPPFDPPDLISNYIAREKSMG